MFLVQLNNNFYLLPTEQFLVHVRGFLYCQSQFSHQYLVELQGGSDSKQVPIDKVTRYQPTKTEICVNIAK